MAGHQNRSKRAPRQGDNPTPEEVKMLRLGAGLSLREFAKMGSYSEEAALQWESGERRMHPMVWLAYKTLLE